MTNGQSTADLEPHDDDSDNQFKNLWEEYKYRHDLIWQRTFTFTTAIVLISIIPYIQPEIVRLLNKSILIAPLLALILAAFGLLVMHNELVLFGKIKGEYRRRQNKLLGKELNNPNKSGYFGLFVTAYFISLLVLCILNCYIVWVKLIPEVLRQPVCPCS